MFFCVTTKGNPLFLIFINIRNVKAALKIIVNKNIYNNKMESKNEQEKCGEIPEF
jgi:hypothetical protein